MAISKFKATCLAVLERVRRTRRPVRITRSGQPVINLTLVTADERLTELKGLAILPNR